MKRFAFWLVALTPGFGAAGACASFGDEPGLPDGGGDDDAGLDGGGVQDGDPPDSGREGGRTPEAGARPCMMPHWLCDDFDGVASSGWMPYLIGEGTLVPRLAPGAPSPPRVLQATVGANAVAAMAAASLGSTKGMTCSFAMRVVQRDTAQGIYFLDLLLPSPDVSSRLGLQLGPAPTTSFTATLASTVLDGGTVLQSTKSASIADGTWVTIAIDMRPTVPRTTVRLDGVLILAATATSVPSPAPKAEPATEARFQLGPGTAVSARQWIVDFDDVVCDLVP
ncbi:MAG: hypothetical protein KF819_20180 [Labilithrix sp.]|nr:hypothetical protein [Labilithrix sp.]